MKNTILVILVISFAVFISCENKTETVEDKDAPKDEVIVKTQEPLEKPDAQEMKEEKSVQEVFITIEKDKFEPNVIVIRKGEKVRFRVKSLDVQHTFTCATLNIKEMINPGEEIVVETIPDNTSKFIPFGCDIHGYFVEKGTITIK